MVCSSPCESSCRHGRSGNGESVNICHAKKSSFDYSDKKIIKMAPFFKSSKKKVAVIGGGVSGLTCARELSLFGHTVSIFEKNDFLGGLLISGIPDFRLDKKIVEYEIRQILNLGIEYKLNISLGKDILINDLISDFDAVIIAAGTNKLNYPDVPSYKSLSVHGIDYLENSLLKESLESFDNVSIIGSSFTAMDCARTAIRHHSKKVNVFARNDFQNNLHLTEELEALLKEGGNKYNHHSLLKVENNLSYFKNSNSHQQDLLIFATGQFPDYKILDKKIKNEILNNNGFDGIFLTGDFKTGSSTLIDAIADAKKISRVVDKYLMKKNRLESKIFSGKKIHSKVDGKPTNRSINMNFLARINTEKIIKKKNNTEVGINFFDEKNSMNESSRCYLCNLKFEIDDKKCVLCDECLKVKPKEKCIVEISSISNDENYFEFKSKKDPSLYYSKLFIDTDECVRCGECERVCPTNAISIQKVSKLEVTI
jgi:NADPH-dependent glutamate synthase beta subunit-like oxidoreductase/NAD-dependent dihydropyrimidine dehydrogenase PreA subunit